MTSDTRVKHTLQWSVESSESEQMSNDSLLLLALSRSVLLFQVCCCLMNEIYYYYFLHCFLRGFKIEPLQKKERVKFIFIEKACYVIVFPDWVFISSWLARTFGGLMCGTRAAAECMLSLGVFKNRRLLKVSMWFKLRFLSTRSKLWPVTSGNNHVTARLAKLATTKPLNRVQKRCKLPAEQHLRCSVSSKSTMPPSPYPRKGGLRNPPHPLRLSSPSSKPHALGDRYRLLTNEACLQRSVAMARRREKVLRSDVVLFTANIRQRRPLQINVQQVLGV